jgi:hypothetical protein
MGGFDLSGGLAQAFQLMNYMEALKKRRLEKENPLPGFERELEQEEGRLGPEESMDDPRYQEYVRQLQRLHGMSGEDPRVSELLKGRKSKAKQKRLEDARRHMAEMLHEVSQFDQQAALNEGVMSQNPEMWKQLQPHLKSARQSMLNSGKRMFETMYPDLVGDKEFQDMMNQHVIESVLGSTSPGGPNQQGLPEGGQQPALPMSTVGPLQGQYGFPQQQAGNPQSPYWQEINRRRGVGR